MATVSSGEGSSAGERKATGPASVHRRTIRPHRAGFIWGRPPYGRFGLSGIPHDPPEPPLIHRIPPAVHGDITQHRGYWYADFTHHRIRSGHHAARTAGRYLLAALVGGVVVVYAFGFVIQSALTGAPLAAVALASMGFVVGDAIKAVVASLAAAGLSKLGR